MKINSNIERYLHFSRCYKISPYGRSLISLRLQYIWANSFVFTIFVGETKTVLLQAYHKDLGPELTFKLWWFSFYLDNLGIFWLRQELKVSQCMSVWHKFV